MKFIITSQHKGEPAKDWLICWTYKSAIMQAHYRTKLDCGSSIKWGVRTQASYETAVRLSK